MLAPDFRSRSVMSVALLAMTMSCTQQPRPDVVKQDPVTQAEPAVGKPPPPRVEMPVEPGIPALASTYRMPPDDVVKIVDAPGIPRRYVSPDRSWMLLAHADHLPSIASIAAPFERLAGVRIDANRYARRRTRFLEKLELVPLGDGVARDIEVPDGSRLSTPRWALDGSSLAFAKWEDSALRLWVADPSTGKARQLSELRLNQVLSPGYIWMPGSQELLVWAVPPKQGPVPKRPTVPSGPTSVDTSGRFATNRTYQDLLKNSQDKAIFEHLVKAQLMRVRLKDGLTTPLGEPQLIIDVEPSPDGKHFLVDRLRRPFSYAVPYYRFARVTEVWDERAKVVRIVSDEGVADTIPIGGVRTGPRSVQWHDQEPATLLWTEALDGGDPKQESEHRDRLMTHRAPFADVPQALGQTEHRLTDVAWTTKAGQALVTEYDRDERWMTTWVYDFKGGMPARKLIDRSVNDAYGDPGDPVYEVRGNGTVVVPVVEGSIFLSGRGASPTGTRPFLDKMALADGKTERIFESGSEEFARFVDFGHAPDHSELVVWRESSTIVPNYHLVGGVGGDRQLTQFADPHPQLTGINKRILKYKRKDGVELSGTLYVPPGHKAGQRLPMVVWAYPKEFNNKDTAGQVRASPNRFTRLRGTSPLMFLTQGYAVLMNAAMPVIGDPETMNDSFIEQIVWASDAAIDAAVAAGVADRDRVGVAGHSYGAFMTANLLAHSDSFRAGIARSGAYNRSLTPFGFQSERRTLWEAPDAYVKVSPLFAADTLNEPILLVHGEADNNSGTHPLQSRRLFHALKGTGGVARLVMLPAESHGYAARESVLHVLAESFEWFDKYVKAAAGEGPVVLRAG